MGERESEGPISLIWAVSFVSAFPMKVFPLDGIKKNKRFHYIDTDSGEIELERDRDRERVSECTPMEIVIVSTLATIERYITERGGTSQAFILAWYMKWI